MDYKEKSREVHGCGKRICMGCAVVEAALRESAAEAFEDAANIAGPYYNGGDAASAILEKAAALRTAGEKPR